MFTVHLRLCFLLSFLAVSWLSLVLPSRLLSPLLDLPVKAERCKSSTAPNTPPSHPSARAVSRLWFTVHDFNFYLFSFLYLKVTERERQRKIFCLLIHTPDSPQQPNLGQTETRSPELCLGLLLKAAGVQVLDSLATSVGSRTAAGVKGT